jgi:IS5 family transposase
MPNQPAIPGLRDAMRKKVTRREKLQAEMDAVVPRTRLLVLIAPHYPKAERNGGRPPMPLATMPRVYFLQNWYALSDPMAKERLYDSEAMRRFAGIELGDDRIPDETTILNFRHLLDCHRLTEAISADVSAHLVDKGIMLRSGTLVDSTIIDAPSSTKNKAGALDLKISSTKKGNTWYFGMKAHVGVDAESSVTHSLETSTAKVHDSRIYNELLHGKESSVWADKRLCQRRGLGRDAQGVQRRQASPRGREDQPDHRDGQGQSRAPVPHPQAAFGYVKTRYRGLAKNRAQIFMLFALGNMFLVRRRLLA